MDAIDLIEIRTHLYHLKRKTIYIYIVAPNFPFGPSLFLLLIQQWKCKLKCTVHRCVEWGKCFRWWNGETGGDRELGASVD